ncbi:XRE family transcriptional regulator, partial [Klebsiella pneumoniae]
RPARVGTSICCSPSPAPTAFRIRIRQARWNIFSSPRGCPLYTSRCV